MPVVKMAKVKEPILPGMEIRLMLTVGSRIFYPSQGPCLIGPIVERTVNDSTISFYQLIVLDDSGDLFVPVDKINAVGIRRLLDKSDIPALLGQLKKPAKPVDTWRQRTINNLKLFASGSAFDLAEIVESLTELSEKKALSYGESKRLDRAKWLLVCEISEVMGQTRQEAEEQIDKALKARKADVTIAEIT